MNNFQSALRATTPSRSLLSIAVLLAMGLAPLAASAQDCDDSNDNTTCGNAHSTGSYNVAAGYAASAIGIGSALRFVTVVSTSSTPSASR